MSYWLTDPELFLYAKGTGPNDVHLWRCKKTEVSSTSSSSLVVPTKPGDFDYVNNVKNYLELIGYMFHWDETDFKRLVKYIFERHLLVNGQGLVVAELHRVDQDDESKMIRDTNKVPFYIRSLDVLDLTLYIPKLRQQPIPSRTVHYLEDINGKAALMEVDSKRSTDDNKLLQALTKKVAHLEGDITKLTTDLVTRTNELATSQLELNRVLEDGENKVWMNDLKNNEWVGVAQLKDIGDQNLIFVGGQGTYARDESNTNVRARYWYKVKRRFGGLVYKAVCLEDLTPDKEKARFSQVGWSYCKSQGKTYIIF